MADVWQRRIDRAERLAAADAASAPLLTFYSRLLRIQRGAYEFIRSRESWLPSGSLERDFPVLCQHWHAAVRAIAAAAPPPLAAQGQGLADAGPAALTDALLSYWRAPSDRQFFAKALLQPYAQSLADARVPVADRHLTRADNCCPFCGGTPQLSILQPAAGGSSEGGARMLLCATCLTSWPFRRVLCAHCGEEDERKLPYFHSPAFDHLRVEACDTCRRYLKGVDQTRLGLAVPIVDEVAGAPLDIWAREHGYEKIELNLVGL